MESRIRRCVKIGNEYVGKLFFSRQAYGIMNGGRDFQEFWRNDMGELSSFPNIGRTIEQQLNEVGIHTMAQLIATGSKKAWLRVKDCDDSACLNRLYALEGAIQGIRWHDLSTDVKTDLKDFYDANK